MKKLLIVLSVVGAFCLVKADPGGFTDKWAEYEVGEFGPKNIEFNMTGLRDILEAPAEGIHPRVYFTPEEIPELRARLATTVSGQTVMKQIHAYNTLLHLGNSYDRSAAYARDSYGNLWIGNDGYWNRSEAYYRLVSEDPDILETLDGTSRNRLASLLTLEAFECLINEGQTDPDTGVSYNQRAVDLAKAMAFWASDALTSGNYDIGGVHMALCYDLNYNNMTTAQRDAVRAVLAQNVPDTPYYSGAEPYATRSNWTGLFSNVLLTHFAIEGEPGSNPTYTKDYMRVYRNFLTYGWYESGVPYEGMGKNYQFVTTMVAAAMRGYSLLGHPHVKAYGEKFLPVINQPFGYSFTSTDVWGGSGNDAETGGFKFHVSDAVGFKWIYPDNETIDFVWKNYIGKWIGNSSEGYVYQQIPPTKNGYHSQLLLCAIFASDYSEGDWEKQNSAALQKESFLGPERGLAVLRSGFSQDDLMLYFHCRQDLGGHTYGDRNTFTLSALGRIWVPYPYGRDYFATKYHSCVLIDDMGIKGINGTGNAVQPGTITGFQDNGIVAKVSGDATYPYSWEWNWQEAGPLADHKLLGTDNWTKVTETWNDFRYIKGEHYYHSIPFYDYAHWWREDKYERFVKRPHNPMEIVHRTASVIKGKHPFTLIVDDVKKDDSEHNFKWLAQVAEDLELESTSVNMDLNDYRADLILKCPSSDRRLLIRVLENKGYSGVGAPAVLEAKTDDHNDRVVIEADGVVTPDFKVMMFPHFAGEELPVTSWNDDNTQLNVSFSDENTTLRFEKIDGRTEIITDEQRPYGGSTRSLPGGIEAEHYDEGGEGIAYHDTTEGNTGGKVRSDNVDIQNSGGNSNVGWTADGEWLEYTVDVAAGSYAIQVSVAAISSGKSILVKLDGAILGTISVPNTGNWGAFQIVTIPNIIVPGGTNKVLRLEFVGGNTNLDWIEFVDTSKTQDISLTKGYNLVSLYIAPDDLSFSSLFSGFLDDIAVTGPDKTAVDLAADTWDLASGYLIKASKDCRQRIQGVPNRSSMIVLKPGLNIYPFRGDEPIDALTFLEDELHQIDYVRDENGNSIRLIDGRWISTIGNFIPGKSYVINSNSGETAVEVFNASDDIGSTGIEGSISYENNTYAITAAGRDIWGQSDSFYYASDVATGDSEMITKVDSLENTNQWAKGGIMFRDGFADDAQFVMLIQRPDGLVSLQWRIKAGEEVSYDGTQGGGGSKWLKLVRIGNLFTGYYSLDGESWIEAGQITVDLPESANIGLAVTSHNATAATRAVFSNVTIKRAGSGDYPTGNDVEALTPKVEALPEATTEQRLKKALLEWGLEETQSFRKYNLPDDADACLEDVDTLLTENLSLDAALNLDFFQEIKITDPEMNPILKNIYSDVEKAISDNTRYRKGAPYEPRRDNKWFYVGLGSSLRIMTWALTHPQSKYRYNPELFKVVMRQLSASLEWWIEGGDVEVSIGDKTSIINSLSSPHEFTDVCLAYLQLQKSMPNIVLPSRYKAWMTNIRNKGDYMFNLVQGLANHLDLPPSEYQRKVFVIPNMDISRITGVTLTGMITGDSSYSEVSEKGLRFMSKFAWEDGAISYVNYENDCFSYHSHIVHVLYKHYWLTKSPLAKELLDRFKPYYPLSVEPAGEAEYYTDTFTKHYWSGRGSAAHGASLMAYYHNCPHNKQVSESVSKKINSPFVAELYDPALKAAEAPDNYVLYDKNIQGPRGRFGRWSFAASGRNFDPDGKMHKGKDTLVGVMLMEPSTYSKKKRPLNAALTGASIYVRKQKERTGRFDKDTLGTTSKEKNTSLIGNGWASFSSNHLPVDFVHNWKQLETPNSVTQAFLMLDNEMVGYLYIDGWDKNPPLPVEGSLRLYDGRSRSNPTNDDKYTIVKQGTNSFSFGAMNIDILQHNFDTIITEKTCLSQFGAIGSNESITLQGRENSDKPGNFYAFKLYPSDKKTAGEMVTSKQGNIHAVKYSKEKAVYRIAVNSSGTDEYYSFKTEGNSLRHQLFEGNGIETEKKIVQPNDEGILKVKIPAYKHVTLISEPQTVTRPAHHVKTSAWLFK